VEGQQAKEGLGTSSSGRYALSKPRMVEMETCEGYGCGFEEIRKAVEIRECCGGDVSRVHVGL
jgi:hypothetical protein